MFSLQDVGVPHARGYFNILASLEDLLVCYIFVTLRRGENPAASDTPV